MTHDRVRRRLSAVIVGGVSVLAPACGGSGGNAPGPVAYATEDLRTGEPADLAEFRGSVVLLSGWATWCAPCREELPELDALYEERQDDGLVVVAVNLDTAGPSTRTVLPFLEAIGVTMPAWIDTDGDFAVVFDAVTMPTNVLIDRTGAVIRTWNGAIEFDAEFEAIIDDALSSTT